MCVLRVEKNVKKALIFINLYHTLFDKLWFTLIHFYLLEKKIKLESCNTLYALIQSPIFSLKNQKHV